MDNDIERMRAAADEPSREALKLHERYRGKIQVTLKCPIRNFDDFAIWYTPGVAAPCLEIASDRKRAEVYTNKKNFVAIVSDGTRVLGLGDIGPEAALPVMEGKALLFKYLGGVDAFPICLKTKDAGEIVRTCRLLEGTFGGINLEDIEQPKCFSILDSLRAEAEIPVWHDDQQGTATVILAGLFNALKVVGKSAGDVRAAMIGAGAAGTATAQLMMLEGFDPGKIIFVDSAGTLHRGRSDFREHCDEYARQWRICEITNERQVEGGIPEAMKDADIVVSFAAPGPGIILPDWVRSMKKDPIVFACANPVPEIWPWEAREAGAAVVATGRSDFPNQVNNSLGFPGIFRGTIDSSARTITDEMCLAAARELALCAEESGISAARILPGMDDVMVAPRIAAAVGSKAIEQGVSDGDLTREDLYRTAEVIIRSARESIHCLMDAGCLEAGD